MELFWGDFQLEELRADIVDLKEMYREQVNLLVNKVRYTAICIEHAKIELVANLLSASFSPLVITCLLLWLQIQVMSSSMAAP